MRKLTFSRRIFIYFLVVILISLVGTAFITYWQSSKELDKNTFKHMSQTVNNAVHHTNIYFEAHGRTVLSLLANEDVKKFVSLSPDEFYEHHVYRMRINENNFKHVIIRNPDIASIYLLSKAGQHIKMNGNVQGIFNYGLMFASQRTYQILDEQLNNQGELEVFDQSMASPDEASLFTLSRRVPKRDNIYEYNGFITIEIHKDELERLWNGIDLGEQGYFFVVNDQGKIIYHPDVVRIGEQIEEELSLKLQSKTGQMIHYELAEEERVYLSRPSNYGGWHLVVSMSLSELRRPIANIRSNTIYMSAITLIIALLITIRFGRSIVEPIRKLKLGMLQTEKGEWMQLPLTGTYDEMDDLTLKYNRMVARLSELVDKVYMAELKENETQMERQKAELQALQLQINPHFIYNTLEAISSYAIIQESKEITAIVKYMADMFRYAVKTNLEEVTIANELKHVLNYMMIMNYRTGWDFEIDDIIPPEYLLRNTVRLTLQPLVENIFQHAFPDGIEEHHRITIDGYMKGDEFIVTVEDNGVGMTEARVNELVGKLQLNKLPDLEPGHLGGIGIVNVHRRIQMVFGEAYGLSIESELSVGTKILMRIPRTS